jgi:dTDP-4-amino-4,6-dideoxygalactose transaminase
MMKPHDVTKEFEKALCEYTGAKHAVVLNSCTMALLICLDYWKRKHHPEAILMPKKTYVSVPQVVLLAGHKLVFKDIQWLGMYQLYPTPIWDCARWLTSEMYCPGQFMCLSFHWTKHLQIGLGGAILHDDDEADPLLRRMRFDGRAEGVDPKDDEFPVLGYHAYLTPALAAEGLTRLALLPKENDPLPNSDYADCEEKFRAWL